jgi:hypothetical protein
MNRRVRKICNEMLRLNVVYSVLLPAAMPQTRLAVKKIVMQLNTRKTVTENINSQHDQDHHGTSLHNRRRINKS